MSSSSSLKNKAQKTEQNFNEQQQYLFNKASYYVSDITAYNIPFLKTYTNTFQWNEREQNDKLFKSHSLKIFGKHWTSDEDDLKGDLNKIWQTWKDKSKDDNGKKFEDIDSKMQFIINKMWEKIYQYTEKHPDSTFVDKAEQKNKNNKNAKFNVKKKRKARCGCFG